MTETREIIAGLPAARVSVGPASRVAVVMLHGYAMRPDDLVPFTHSLGTPAEFYLPEAPLDAKPAGRAWWPIDHERRGLALAAGPRDLFEEHPAGAAAARRTLREFVLTVRSRHPDLPLVLLGFSQGGMLACDAVLRTEVGAAGLALLSSSRISADIWESLAPRLRGLPVLISHGDGDSDLAFCAGEALRDFCLSAGAIVTWVPFNGGHEIPLVVWRRLRLFLDAFG